MFDFIQALAFILVALSLTIVWFYTPSDRVKWLLNYRADYIAVPSVIIGCAVLLLLAVFHG